jgi:hypothetical protein
VKEEELKKIDITKWEEKTHLSHLPMHHGSALFNVNRYLNEIEDILREAGMEGLGYQDQEKEIEELIEDQANLNAYINSAGWEFQEKIDTPLYKGFQNDAAEELSRINLEDYTTENTLEIKKHHVMYDSYGNRLEYDTTAPSLSMADFLGISSLGTGSADGKLVGIPEEFKDFTSMFTMEYDSIKENLKDKDGNPISLEEYLNELYTYGEFDNKMDKPFLEFVSCILDVTIVKPLIEMCWGYDLITGEDLSDFERGMKGVFAVIDVVSLMIGIKASGVVKIFSKNTLKMAGKSVLLDAFGGAGAYGIGQIGQELGLPLPITLLMSMGAGIGIVKVGGRYLFKDQAGNVLLDVAEKDLDALRKGVSGTVDDVLETPTQTFKANWDAEIPMFGSDWDNYFRLQYGDDAVNWGTEIVTDISKLKGTENFTDNALNHILEGEINLKNRAVGFHYEGFPTQRGSIISGTESLPNSQGVYTAMVEVDSTVKRGISSFFPKDWTPQNIVDAINEAYSNKGFIRGNRYSGMTSAGIEIEMFLDVNGNIVSAYPIY